MAKESQLWKWLRGAMDGESWQDVPDMVRVENMLGAGFPDVDGCYLGTTFKLELKSKPRPSRITTPIRFPLEKRIEQIAFLKRRWLMGEAAYFLLQVGEGHDRRIYLAPGDAGDRLRTGINESELAVLCATEEGRVFPKGVKAIEVIEGVRTCYKRRHFP